MTSEIEKLKEIIYEGIFCDVNECASQYIDISSFLGGSSLPKIKISKPCNCGGEKRRLEMIKSIQQLLDLKEKETKEEIVKQQKVKNIKGSLDVRGIERFYLDDLVNWINNELIPFLNQT